MNTKTTVSKRILSLILAVLMVATMFTFLASVLSVSAAEDVITVEKATAALDIPEYVEPAPGTLVGTYYIQNGFRNYPTSANRTTYSEFIYGSENTVKGNMNLVADGMATAANSVNDVTGIAFGDEYKWNVYQNGNTYYIQNVVTKQYLVYGNDSGNVVNTQSYDGNATTNMGFVMSPAVNGDQDGDRTFTFADETINTVNNNVIGNKAFTVQMQAGSNWLSAGFDGGLAFDTASTANNVYVRNDRQGAELWNFIQVIDEPEVVDRFNKFTATVTQPTADVDTGSVALSWNAITNADKYVITYGGKSIEVVGTEITLSDLAVGEYTFTITAYDADGNVLADSEGADITAVTTAAINEYVEFTPGTLVGTYYIQNGFRNYPTSANRTTYSEFIYGTGNTVKGNMNLVADGMATAANSVNDVTGIAFGDEYKWNVYQSGNTYYIQNVATKQYLVYGNNSGNVVNTQSYDGNTTTNMGFVMSPAVNGDQDGDITFTFADETINTANNNVIGNKAFTVQMQAGSNWLSAGFDGGLTFDTASTANNVYIRDNRQGAELWNFIKVTKVIDEPPVSEGEYDISVKNITFTGATNGVVQENKSFWVNADLAMDDNNSGYNGTANVTITVDGSSTTVPVTFTDGVAHAQAMFRLAYPYDDDIMNGNSAYKAKVEVTVGSTDAAHPEVDDYNVNNTKSTDLYVIANKIVTPSEDDENYADFAGKLFTLRNSYHFDQTDSGYDDSNIYIFDDLNSDGVKLDRFGAANAENHGDTVATVKDENGGTVYETDENGDIIYLTDENGEFILDTEGNKIPVPKYQAPTIEDNPEFFWYVDPATGGILNYATHRFLTRTDINVGVYQKNTGNEMLMTYEFTAGKSNWDIAVSGVHSSNGCTVGGGNVDHTRSDGSQGYVITSDPGSYKENVLGVDYPGYEFGTWGGRKYITDGDAVTAMFFPEFADTGSANDREGCTWYLEKVDAPKDTLTYTVNAVPVLVGNDDNVVVDEVGMPIVNNNAGSATPNSARVIPGSVAQFTATPAADYEFVGWYGFDVDNNLVKLDDNSVFVTPAVTVNGITYYAAFRYLNTIEYNFLVSIQGEGTVDAYITESERNTSDYKYVVATGDKDRDPYGDKNLLDSVVDANLEKWAGTTDGDFAWWLTERQNYVTLEATQTDSDYVFVGWQDVLNKDMIRNPDGSPYEKLTLQIPVGTKNHIRAIFINKNELVEDNNVKVTVRNSKTGNLKQFIDDNSISHNYLSVEKGTAFDSVKDIITDMSGEVLGYELIAYEVFNGTNTDTYTTYEDMVANVTFNTDTLITAIYKAKEGTVVLTFIGNFDIPTQYSNVKALDDGTGFAIELKNNQSFTVTSKDTNESGEAFSYWKQGNDIVSNNITSQFSIGSKDETVTAVYGDDKNKLDKPTNTLTSYAFDETSGYLYLFQHFDPLKDDERYTIVEKGALLLENKGVSVDQLTIDTTGVLRARSTSLKDSFYARKAKAVGHSWYAQSYVLYLDENNNLCANYGEMISINGNPTYSVDIDDETSTSVVSVVDIDSTALDQSNAYIAARNYVQNDDSFTITATDTAATGKDSVLSLGIENPDDMQYLVLKVKGTAKRDNVQYANKPYGGVNEAGSSDYKALTSLSGSINSLSTSNNYQYWIIDIKKSGLSYVDSSLIDPGSNVKNLLDMTFVFGGTGEITISGIYLTNNVTVSVN